MRGAIAVGVLSALLVGLLIAGAVLVMALGRPGLAIPTLPSVAIPSLPPTPGLTAGSTTSPSPRTSPERAPTPSPSSTPTASPSTPAEGSASPDVSVPVGLRVGDLAPPLAVPGLGGAEVDTSLLAGQPLWINFMATWCPPCRDELPVMERMGTQLGDSMTILVIDVGEDEAAVESFMTELGVTLSAGLDGSGVAQRAWGAYALPVHYWVGPDGRIGGFLYGGAGPEQFIDGIHSVLPDASLEP